MTFTAPAHLARALVNTTKAVDATVKNIGHADWNGISFSDGLGDMTVDSFNPAVAFDLAIDAQRGFTASVAAGLTRGERGFKVKADNGSFNVVSNRLLTVVGPRTFDAMAVAAFGRVMANQAVSGGSRTLAGATTTPDNYYANPQLPTGAAGSSGGVSLNNAGAAVTFDVANGSKSAALTVSGNFAGTGLHSGSVPITSLIAELSESYSVSVPYSATALADRTFTGDAIAFGVIHIDGTGSASTTIRTGGASDSYTSVAVPGNSDLVVTIANDATVFNGAMNLARSATTAAIRTAGNFSGSVTLNPGMEADVGGTQSPQSFVVGYSGQVFSGNATWSGVGGVWGDRTTNAGGWADDNVVVPAIHAAPGTFGWPFDDEDQATFSGDGGIVSLNSVSPSVKTLIFGGANGYTIAQGTGGTLFLKETTSASITTSGSATHQIGAPVNLASDVVVVTDVDLALSGGLGGAGALTKLGTGTLTLSGAIGYAGVTTVSAGTLVVNGTMNTQVNAVSVTSTTSAKLTGTGSLARPVSIGDKGTIEPTGATGTLTVKSLTMASGATFAVAASGATCGQLVVSGGAVSLGDGVATLSLSGTAAGSPLTLVTDASGVSGYFKDESGTPLTEGTSVTFGGRTFRISYTGGKVMLGGAAEGTLFLIR
jgi:autotransporter-associated beta strand protein